ncbi:FUSC family protein [Actinocorallia sp. A-T 12471]|uniref:FUSC family protein n=1 Tax=Actinocorallia sp. A-T 12471 TaxID=3089813 RepID=UPI0029CBD27E|nr:FUSC family protein [Actinocorallia sp. A-T 12471]MDX6744819.1 FUSC family protein [Actinocorallia sp. A-T 12471]
MTAFADSFRDRTGRLRVMALPIVQVALAAGLAWIIATRLLGHDRPFFAPIAVVLCIGVGLGTRRRRVWELVAGVSVGVGVGDLLISLIGGGAWQIALVVALAMAVSVLLDGGTLISLQAGSSAVLVATLLPPGGTGGIDRMVDALVGGLVGLVAVALLPANPAGLAAKAIRELLEELSAALEAAAAALRERDPEIAAEALERARGSQGTVDKYRDSLVTAHEIAALSPLHRARRDRLETYATAAEPLDHALRNARVLLRHTVAMIEKGEPAPDLLVDGMGELAQTAVRLRDELIAGGTPLLTRRVLRRTAARLDPVPLPPLGFSAHVVLAQLRSLAVDLLEATGAEHEEALAAFPHRPATRAS